MAVIVPDDGGSRSAAAAVLLSITPAILDEESYA
jgi:hypothetical protein